MNLAPIAIVDPSFEAQVLPDGGQSFVIPGPRRLGQVDVEGVGAVSVIAQREGKRVVLRAGGPDGSALGRAEAPIGLDRTPIFVKTPSGLEKIVVVWEAGADEAH